MNGPDPAVSAIGPLSLSADGGEFFGSVGEGPLRVDVTFDLNGHRVTDAVVEMGNNFLRDLVAWRTSAVEHVCRTMLELKNGTWLHEGEDPLSQAEFKQRLRLIQAWLDDSGKRTLTFEDGGMFWGHDVMLDVNPDGSFNDPHLYG